MSGDNVTDHAQKPRRRRMDQTMRYSDAAALMPKKLPRYDARPVPVDPSLQAALAWRTYRVDLADEEMTRRALTRLAQRRMAGSRYQGGASFAARGR
jgi:hypothetical protein